MTLIKQSFEVPIYISRLPNHEQLKQPLLEILRSLDAPRNQSEGSDIAHCSYEMPALNSRWHRVFFEAARDHLAQLYAELDTPDWAVHRAWYQSYDPGNTHLKHNHGGCAWANVYYLELPHPTLGTIFHHPAEDGVKQRGCLASDSPPILQPEVTEGDIVTFPGYLQHESPVIEGEAPKTIISFNVVAKQQKRE